MSLPLFLKGPVPRRLREAARARRRRGCGGGGDDAGGGGVDALRRRTRASIDGRRGRRAAALRAGRRGHLSPPAAHRLSDLSAGFGQQGGRGGTLAPAPSDARF
eukprot:scaffold20652_cov44-Phaeocystis_antarctica.AAC.1